MNQIKKLAGQTAYYGISSILARVLNFLLLPIWTDRLIAEQYGVVTYMYSFIAIILIVYTFGMETAFFRFARKADPTKTYQSSASAVILISGISSALLTFFAGPIAEFLGEGVRSDYLRFMAAILFIDAAVAIPFAKLRLEEKALRFAVIKTTVVSITILLNLFLLVLIPDITAGKYLNNFQDFVINNFGTQASIQSIFVANLAANLLYLPLLLPELKQLRLRIEWRTFKPMLQYAFPLFLMGLAGMFNEQGYALILKYAFPADMAESANAALGKYGSVVKLSVIMMLGIQAFRYAAEPFFFNHSDNKEAPELFAKIMHYFVVFNIIILFGVAANTELISDIFIRRPEYKEALFALPVLLVAKLFYGVYINLSVWFKIKDKTRFGAYFAGIGALITLAGNLFLIPVLGYYGAAVAGLACYAVMSTLCYFYGKKHFPIPYKFAPLFMHLAICLLLLYGLNQIELGSQWMNYGLHLCSTAVYAGLIFWYEWRNLDYKTLKQ